jgi:DNA-binding transcriptional regulator YbjK
MTQYELAPLQRRRYPLSVRVSLWMVSAAIIPLIITVIVSELLARPALVSQANAAMQSDAKTRVQLIDTYFNERMLDAETLAQVPSVQTFLAAQPGTPGYQDLATHAAYSLLAGNFRDKNYTNWSLFDPQGNLRLYYPSQPVPHGNYLVPPEYLKQVLAGKTFITDVYYNPAQRVASVDIYSPIADATTHTVLGFIRSTLKLDYIWNIVKDDTHNGQGSYAFILDENGIRIADSRMSNLFETIKPLSPTVQRTINAEKRFGAETTVPLTSDSTFAHMLQVATPTTFQAQPVHQHEQFQIAVQSAKNVPWTYFVLSPVNTVTAVANNQMISTALIAALILVVVIVGGSIAGRRLTEPIMNSVEYLRNSSQALSSLAVRQQDAASEQMWVVDSSQVGLQSVQYYTEATRYAATQLHTIGNELIQNWHMLNEQAARQRIERIMAAAQYIENATEYQAASTQKLSTALKVATQVTEQLAQGATSATDAANQLEQVVKRLRHVVGK